MSCLFESLTRSAVFRTGPGQTFRTRRKFLRPSHRRDEPRPAIPQRVARQHCPPTLHRHAHPNSVPGSGTMNLQRTVNSVLTVCLSPGDNPRRRVHSLFCGVAATVNACARRGPPALLWFFPTWSQRVERDTGRDRSQHSAVGHKCCPDGTALQDYADPSLTGPG